MPNQIAPFHLSIPDAALADLQDRLSRTRWPDAETVPDTSQGPQLAKLMALCDYWQTTYDWRRCEALLNGLGQFRTEIDGLGIHFLHIRSPEPDAMPLILTHGWPGSVLECRDVIGPLTNPAAHGGDPRDAFHLVIPSLPGFGFSDKPTGTGWGISRIADAWVTLMVITAVSAIFIRSVLPNIAGFGPIHLFIPVTLIGESAISFPVTSIYDDRRGYLWLAGRTPGVTRFRVACRRKSLTTRSSPQRARTMSSPRCTPTSPVGRFRSPVPADEVRATATGKTMP